MRRGTGAARRLFGDKLRKAVRIKPLIVGVGIVVPILLFVLCGPLVIQAHPLEQNLRAILQPPSLAHPFGTDALGRDLLSRVAWGGRPAFVIAVSSVLLGGAIGVTLGLVGGFVGGAVDRVIVRISDILLSFPSIIVAIAFVGIGGAGVGGLIGALTLVATPRFARVTRGQVLSLRNREFVVAAAGLGAKGGRIMFIHVLPNIFGPLVILGSLMLPATIYIEATLSFLGLGVSPETPTWGKIIADGRNYILVSPWITLFPGLVLSVASLGLNLIGDGLRDLLDVHVK